jgi:hypothetical protein
VQPRKGSLLTAGRLQLVSGLAQIEFYSGARLILDGPGNVELVSANQAICHAGRLRAQVPPQARGFSITAPKFKVVDLGTEFGLEVASIDGVMIEHFGDFKTSSPADIQADLDSIALAAAKGKFVVLKGWPGFNWLDKEMMKR